MPVPSISDFGSLTSAQVLALPRDKTVFLFSAGPWEDHGPHLPLGLDTLEAEALARREARRLEADLPGWSFVIFPALPLGLDSNTGALAITVRAHVLRDWLVDTVSSLMREGFVHFACFSGHGGPRQLTAIEEAGQLIYRRTRWVRLIRRLTGRGGAQALPYLVSVSSALVEGRAVKASPFFLDAREHGGRRDTSVALALGAPVDAGFKELPARAWSAASHWRRLLNRRRRLTTGYWGRPAEAGAAWGESELETQLSGAHAKLLAVIRGADPNFLFRSWYSVLPPNRSFFKAWLLAMGFFAVMLAWIYLNFQALMS